MQVGDLGPEFTSSLALVNPSSELPDYGLIESHSRSKTFIGPHHRQQWITNLGGGGAQGVARNLSQRNLSVRLNEHDQSSRTVPVSVKTGERLAKASQGEV